jgi:hypothetical protein
MSQLPKFADNVSADRRRGAAKDGEFRLGPLWCFLLGFMSGAAAIWIFGDMSILRYYVITALR